MNFFDTIFSDLANRLRGGDPNAGALLRDYVEKQLIYIVRRTLREGDGKRPLDDRILSEARRIRAETHDQPMDSERLARAVVHSLSENVVAQLHRRQPRRRGMDDTVRTPIPTALVTC